MKLKNNVCSNLTTKTSKFRHAVSQLSLQCFLSFLLSLLSKKSKHIFFRKFFHVTLKNSYFEFGVEIEKNDSPWVFVRFRQPFAKVWANSKLNLGVVYCIFSKKYSSYRQNGSHCWNKGSFQNKTWEEIAFQFWLGGLVKVSYQGV